MTSGLMRLLIVVHRYVGVVVGLLMALWCLSGFVMMYQTYPRLAAADRLKGLAPLTRPAATAWTVPGLADDAEVRAFRLEMTAGKPLLHLQYGPRRDRTFDLATGQDLDGITSMQALGVAWTYAAGNRLLGRPTDLGLVDVDQWTLDGINRAGPMHRIRFDDQAGTELYVAASTGEAVQMTTRRTRLLAWLGAIPHWLYPTILRSHPPVWDAVVVWASILGAFLTVIGLYIGIARIGVSKSGRWSPYRGWFYWHHLTGLIFGVMTLTWVGSGLLTMTPWGLLDSSAGQAERGALAGSMTGAQVKRFLAAAPRLMDGRTVSIESAPLEGRLYALVKRPGQTDERVDETAADHPLQFAELREALGRMGGGPIKQVALQTREDAYYYSGFDGPALLPAYRVDLADPASTSLYVSPATGRMVGAIDHVGRQSRWLRTGLHDLDFFAGLRARPVWDVVVILLLLGVTGATLVGTWLALKRIGRDAKGLAAQIGRRLRPPPLA